MRDEEEIRRGIAQAEYVKKGMFEKAALSPCRVGDLHDWKWLTGCRRLEIEALYVDQVSHSERLQQPKPGYIRLTPRLCDRRYYLKRYRALKQRYETQ